MSARGRRRYSEEEERRILDEMAEQEREEYAALAIGSEIAVANIAAMREIRNAAMARMAVKW
jgi:hypothetical protein